MPDPARPAKIHDLVAEARKAIDLRERLANDGKDPGEVDEALEGLYRDIGRAVVAAVAAGGMIPEVPAAPPETFTDELPDVGAEDDGSWYTDEVEVEKPASGPLFAPGELDETTEVPEADHNPPSVEVSQEDTDPQPIDFVVETVGSMRARASEDLACGLAQLRVHGDGVPWKGELDELLALLALPADFEDAKELAVEAARVQWAANELAFRLQPYPDDLQVCLVGLLASRAQHLRGKLDVDVGLRSSLDRMQRYRIDMDLPVVAGLLPNPTPEHGAWVEDVLAWWGLLRPGPAA